MVLERDDLSFSLDFAAFHDSVLQFRLYPENISQLAHSHSPSSFFSWALSWLPSSSDPLSRMFLLPRDCLQAPGLLGMAVLPASQIQLQVQRIHYTLKWQDLPL